jgi:hypothetical protein
LWSIFAVPVATSFLDYYELYRHFEDHGSDFGSVDEIDYLRECREFLNADVAVATDIQECVRKSTGDIIRFNPTNDYYAVMSITGIIKTFFKPMPRHVAPPGFRGIRHRFATNQAYFEECCRQ